MRRGVCVFLLQYGTAMLILAGTLGFGHKYHDPWYFVLLGTTAAGCMLAALGLYFAKRSEPITSKRWIAGILLAIIAQWALLFLLDLPDVNSIDVKGAVKSIAFLVPFAGIAFLFSCAQPRHFQPPGRQFLQMILLGTMLVGAVLVLLTLVLKTTGSAKGWQIAAQKARWITYDYDLAGILPQTDATSWIPALFAVGGCAVYLLALTEAIATIGWAVFRRASVQRLCRSRWLPWLAGASCFTTLYLYNDIFWGWQSVAWNESLDMNDAVWYPVAGLVLWLAAVAGTFWIAIASSRQAGGSLGLSMLQVALLPIAGFNFLMMPAYFEGIPTDFPGLGLLMIGSQLLSWGYLGLLMFAENEKESGPMNPMHATNAAAAT